MAREVTTVATDEPESKEKKGLVNFLKELPILIALALTIALIIKTFLVQAFWIPSGSMEPTLAINDRVLVNKLTYRFHEPERGDVVVFSEPRGDICAQKRPVGLEVPPECDRNILQKGADFFRELFGIPSEILAAKDYIKRIVALPGETLELKDGVAYINGKKTDFASERDVEGPQLDDANYPPIKLTDGHYWVMGDNRADSQDSRSFGPISRDKILGRAFVVLWPPNRFNGL